MEFFDPFLHEPDNAQLKSLLIALTEDRQPNLRTKFYQLLLGSELLVLFAAPEGAIEPNPEEPAEEITLISFLDENKEPVMPVFTDHEALEKFMQGADKALGMKAVDLCNIALGNGIQKLVFDPGQSHSLALNGYEMQELGKGMIPVGGEAIHRLEADTEYSLGPASEDAPNPEFRAALIKALPDHKIVLGAYLFHLGTAEQTPELTLGLLFAVGTGQGEMVETMNSLFEVSGHFLGKEDALNVMPLTDDEMESRLFSIGAQIYSSEY